jgi:hypothetical protein
MAGILGVRAQGHAARIRWLALQGVAAMGPARGSGLPSHGSRASAGKGKEKQERGRLTRGPHMAVIEGEG